MTPIAVLAALTLLVVLLGLGRTWLPWKVIRCGYLLAVLTPLLGLGYAIWQLWHLVVGWPELALLCGMYVVAGFGLTVGYHRMLAHRSFETGPAIKAVLLVLGAMALPTRPLDFVAYHLQHHARADREGDPHSPHDGLLHAHVGWMLGQQRPDRERYCRHLANDPVVGFVDRHTLLCFGLGLAIPTALDGWQGFLWGGLVRLAVQSHATFAVNSLCHAFGSSPFATGDESRNNLAVALWSLGEGWHNNHHAFPSAAAHGIGWRQPDISALLIGTLDRLGLVWNVRGVPPEVRARRYRGTRPLTEAMR